MAEVPKALTDQVKALDTARRDLAALLRVLRREGDAPLALDAALATFRDRWKPAGLAEGAEALAAWARDAAEGLRPRV
ncbi:MAG: hypothetical protein FJ098_06970, partial [Deltaproteobacteria bacterium]|nr:hypothetical protein [Deltaproteobacteria bacterium]